MLSDTAPSKSVSGVVWIRVFSWLIADATTIPLAAEVEVALHSVSVEKPFTVEISVSFRSDIKQFKSSSLPEIVAAIDELVNSTVKASLDGQLTLSEPV
jgi:hypothetical protein